MKKKIPFSLDYKEKIESGEVSVVTRDDKPMKIVCWDAEALNPKYFTGIQLLARRLCDNGWIQFGYSKDGKFCGDESEDLFLLVEDDKLTVFERAVAGLINGVHAGFTYSIKGEAEILLDIARKQLDDEDDSVYCRGVKAGKEAALKDMPKWERATEDLQIGCLVWDERRKFHLYMDRVSKGELYISMADILRLPGSPKEGEE